jgi:hypothetical protein
MLGVKRTVFAASTEGTRGRRVEILEVNEARKVLPRLVFLLEFFKRMGQARKCFANKAKFRICVCQVLTAKREIQERFLEGIAHINTFTCFFARDSVTNSLVIFISPYTSQRLLRAKVLHHFCVPTKCENRRRERETVCGNVGLGRGTRAICPENAILF